MTHQMLRKHIVYKCTECGKRGDSLWVLRTGSVSITLANRNGGCRGAKTVDSKSHPLVVTCALISPCGGGGISPHDANEGALFSWGLSVAASLRVKNWDRFQKQHTSEYIRLYTALLYDGEFCELPDAAQLILIKVWLSAAHRQGQVSGSAATVLRQCGVQYSSRAISYFKLLVDKGFLVSIDRQTDTTETEKRDKKQLLSASQTALSGCALNDSTPHNRYDVSHNGGESNALDSKQPEAPPKEHSDIHTAQRSSDAPISGGKPLNGELTPPGPQSPDFCKPEPIALPKAPNDARSGDTVTASAVSDGRSPVQDGAPPKETNGGRRRRASGDKPRATWLTPIEKVWEEWNGVGSFAGVMGQAMEYLSDVYHAHGAETVAAHVGQYLAETDGEPHYRSIPKFASNFASYAPKPMFVNGVPSDWLWKATEPRT